MIDVANESGVELEGTSEADIAACARHVLDALHVHPQAELSVLLVDPPTIASLHGRWLDDPEPTDVMSFPMDELRPGTEARPAGPGLLGDVVLCPQVAAAQATARGHAPAEEVLLLTVHGVLHLLGYDHAEPEEEKVMVELQRTLLQSFRAERR
ncbi:MAG: rRNA maturation RNase YbeY [Kineosporiaceae bacterium]